MLLSFLKKEAAGAASCKGEYFFNPKF